MSNTSLNEQIVDLTTKYYELIGRDHHKDRDCHFYINSVYSYGNPPYYKIEHYGYVNELTSLENDRTYILLEEAKEGLIEVLNRLIIKEETRTCEEAYE